MSNMQDMSTRNIYQTNRQARSLPNLRCRRLLTTLLLITEATVQSHTVANRRPALLYGILSIRSPH